MGWYSALMGWGWLRVEEGSCAQSWWVCVRSTERSSSVAWRMVFATVDVGVRISMLWVVRKKVLK